MGHRNLKTALDPPSKASSLFAIPSVSCASGFSLPDKGLLTSLPQLEMFLHFPQQLLSDQLCSDRGESLLGVGRWVSGTGRHPSAPGPHFYWQPFKAQQPLLKISHSLWRTQILRPKPSHLTSLKTSVPWRVQQGSRAAHSLAEVSTLRTLKASGPPFKEGFINHSNVSVVLLHF